jgi:aspartate-semialdehyde dehydrogenase
LDVEKPNSAKLTMAIIPHIEVKANIIQEEENMSEEAKRMLLFYAQYEVRRNKK